MLKKGDDKKEFLHGKVKLTMLGTFPKAFPNRQLPKGIFPSGNFPNVQFFNWLLPKSVLAAALGHPPLVCSRRSACPPP